VYLNRQGANVLHPLPSPSRSFDKTFLRMACPSTHLALPQATCCHIEIEPELSTMNIADVTQVALDIFLKLKYFVYTMVPISRLVKNFLMKANCILSFTLLKLKYFVYTMVPISRLVKNFLMKANCILSFTLLKLKYFVYTMVPISQSVKNFLMKANCILSFTLFTLNIVWGNLEGVGPQPFS
jgi:hypothetical protein